ncbi:class II aldolase/adducin family protein [Treponema socranskii]|jgi:class II aldolase/adducin family protein|uniref:class II aldolase/adducin family protein n=2 Tax=Treponema socranskii TaxID=53419 RepID=UPI0028F0B674|nr:class II aldolase/adducin family protein [Treponema socranskii]
MKRFYKERVAVANFMKRLYDRQLTTASGGNISLRVSDDEFCITPSSLDKGSLTAESIAVVKFDGTNLTPELKLSIESEMHRQILLKRPDLRAVVHAHPVFASAFATAQPCVLDSRLIAETYFILGEIVNVPYFIMGSKELADAVSEAVVHNTAVLLENHGALCAAKDLLHAFDGIDLMERLAQMTILRRFIDNSHIMTESQCKEITDVFKLR